jgi:hypothetical protein
MSISNYGSTPSRYGCLTWCVWPVVVVAAGVAGAYVQWRMQPSPIPAGWISDSNTIIEIPDIFRDTAYVHQYSVVESGPWTIESWSDGAIFKPSSTLCLTYRITNSDVEFPGQHWADLVSKIQLELSSRAFSSQHFKIAIDRPTAAIKTRTVLFAKPSVPENFRLINLRNAGNALEITTSIKLPEVTLDNRRGYDSATCLVLSTLSIGHVDTHHEAVVMIDHLRNE